MDLVLQNGEPFTLVFPVLVLMRRNQQGDVRLEPVWYPGGKAVAIYTDDDLAQRVISTQDFTDMVAVPVSTPEHLRLIIEGHERLGAVNVAIDVCTQPNGGGHLTPIPIALGRRPD